MAVRIHKMQHSAQRGLGVSNDCIKTESYNSAEAAFILYFKASNYFKKIVPKDTGF